jgi:hypothetical protein
MHRTGGIAVKKKSAGKGIKGIVSVCLLFAVVLPLLWGCTPATTGKRQLWVVTESPPGPG